MKTEPPEIDAIDRRRGELRIDLLNPLSLLLLELWFAFGSLRLEVCGWRKKKSIRVRVSILFGMRQEILRRVRG